MAAEQPVFLFNIDIQTYYMGKNPANFPSHQAMMASQQRMIDSFIASTWKGSEFCIQTPQHILFIAKDIARCDHLEQRWAQNALNLVNATIYDRDERASRSVSELHNV